MLLIDTLLDSGDPIWVRNVHKPPGIVVLTLVDGSGRSAVETIPKVRHPICLSARATPSMLRNSMDLRNLIQKGVLQLVTDKEAKDFFRDNPEAEEDVQLAYSRLGTHDPRVLNFRGDGGDIVVAKADGDAAPLSKEEQQELAQSGEIRIRPAEEDGNVSSRVKGLLQSLSSGELRARDVKSELDTLDLTEDDLAYTVAQSSGIVKTWAKKRLASLRSQKEPPDEESVAEETA